MPGKNSTRLNKYISESGLCSRREADRYTENGNVAINGKGAQVGDQVLPGDTGPSCGLNIFRGSAKLCDCF